MKASRVAMRMGVSSPMAGEEWREGGAHAPPWVNQVLTYLWLG